MKYLHERASASLLKAGISVRIKGQLAVSWIVYGDTGQSQFSLQALLYSKKKNGFRVEALGHCGGGCPRPDSGPVWKCYGMMAGFRGVFGLFGN